MKLNILAVNELMVRKGLNKSKLAATAGISRQHLSVIFGKAGCTASSAVKIADALGVRLEEIVKED